MSELLLRSDAKTTSTPEGSEGARVYFDECFSSADNVRPHWHDLASSLQRMGQNELELRARSIRRILAENGVSCFNKRGSGREEPWQLDPIPMPLASDEWRELETGLIQRARLLNLILRDLYGTQHLVRDGLVPAPLLFANPGFLRACQAIKVVGGV
jgi:uncharacterized circularly permuted ATP-grasp superfamily protein